MKRIYKLLLESDQPPVTVSENVKGTYPELEQWGWDSRDNCPILSPSSLHRPAEAYDANHNLRRKVQFESELALLVLKNNALFRDLLHRLGKATEQYFRRKARHDRDFMTDAGRIYRQYYYTDKPYLGRKGSFKAGWQYSASEIYHQSLLTLTKGKDIPQIMFGHMASITIYAELLNKKEEVASLKKWLKPKAWFARRGRVKIPAENGVSTWPGIEIDQPSTLGRVDAHSKTAHHTARETDPDKVSEFVYHEYTHDIPFIGGPSGSAAECLSFMHFFSKGLAEPLTFEEMKMYTLCCIGYLISAGSHSFHEVASIAKLMGIPYYIGQYHATLPECFTQTADYQNLLQKYPDLIWTEDDYTPFYVADLSDESNEIFSASPESSYEPPRKIPKIS